MKWARQNGCPWDKTTCSRASWEGHLDVLKWARENRCPWDWATCRWAAGGGHLDVLKWARENGCPWDKTTCSGAALNGHLHVLKWARQNGCPWDEETCGWVALGGHLATDVGAEQLQAGLITGLEILLHEFAVDRADPVVAQFPGKPGSLLDGFSREAVAERIEGIGRRRTGRFIGRSREKHQEGKKQ